MLSRSAERRDSPKQADRPVSSIVCAPSQVNRWNQRTECCWRSSSAEQTLMSCHQTPNGVSTRRVRIRVGVPMGRDVSATDAGRMMKPAL